MKKNGSWLKDFLTEEEWELLCDCCGLCCLYKIRDEDTHELFFTSVICPFLDKETAHCKCYRDRFIKMPTCTKISPKNLPKIANWLPKNCAYRCLYERTALPDWHPLNSDDSPAAAGLREKLAGICVRPNTCISKKTAERIVKESKPARSRTGLTELLVENVIDTIDI